MMKSVRLRKEAQAALSALAIFCAWCLPAKAEQFSIMCKFIGGYYVTFDTQANRAVYEDRLTGRAMKGTINSVTKGEIAFDLLIIAKPKVELIWNEDRKELIVFGIQGDPTRQWQVHDCDRTNLRPILSEYKNIAPME